MPFDDVYNYLSIDKIPIYVIFCFIMTILIILSCTVTINKELTIKQLMITTIIMHSISIFLYCIALYFKKTTSEVYSLVLINIVTIYIVSLTLYLHVYKQYRDSDLRNSWLQRLLQLMIVFTLIMIISNILLRNIDLMYIINIIFAIGMLSFVGFIYKQQ